MKHYFIASNRNFAKLMLSLLASLPFLAMAQTTEDPVIIENKRVRIEIRKHNGISDTTISEDVQIKTIDGSSSELINAANSQPSKKVKMQIREVNGVMDTLILEETETTSIKLNPKFEEQIEETIDTAIDEAKGAGDEAQEMHKKVIVAHSDDDEDHNVNVDDQGNHKVVVRREIKVEEKHTQKYKSVETSWFVMDLGWNVWLTDNVFELQEDYSDLALDRGNSINFHLGIVQKGINLYKGKLRLVYGLGIEFNNYHFENNVDLVKGSKPLEFTINPDVNYKKNKVVTKYATLPIMLNFKGKGGKSDDEFKLAAGIQLGYLLGAHQKQKWGSGSDKDKQKLKGDFGFEDYRLAI
jgi:hypothetical protein